MSTSGQEPPNTFRYDESFPRIGDTIQGQLNGKTFGYAEEESDGLNMLLVTVFEDQNMSAYSAHVHTPGLGMFSELMHQNYRYQLHSFKLHNPPILTRANIWNTMDSEDKDSEDKDSKKPISTMKGELLVCPPAAQITLL